MSRKVKPRIPDKELIKRLNLMHDSGGMLTKDRLNVIEQAAERIAELSITSETEDNQEKSIVVGGTRITFQDTFDLLSGGGEDESITQ